MKRVLIVILIIGCLFLFTGCFDVFQYVSLDGDDVDLSIKFVVQKSIIDMASSFSGESVNYDELLAQGHDTFRELDAFNAEIRPINNGLEVGYEISIKGSLQKIQEHAGQGAIPFFPKKRGSSFFMSLPEMGVPMSEGDEMAYAFLASAKYRVLLDLSGDLESVKNARITLPDGRDSNDKNMEVITTSIYGKVMLIEIPLLIPLLSQGSIEIELY